MKTPRLAHIYCSFVYMLWFHGRVAVAVLVVVTGSLKINYGNNLIYTQLVYIIMLCSLSLWSQNYVEHPLFCNGYDKERQTDGCIYTVTTMLHHYTMNLPWSIWHLYSLTTNANSALFPSRLTLNQSVHLVNNGKWIDTMNTLRMFSFIPMS